MKLEKRVTENEEKVINKFQELLSQEAYDTESENGLELYETTLRANEFYSKILERYLKSNVVIQFNLIQHIKENAKTFKDLADMTFFVWNIIETLVEKEENDTITEIEKKELKVAKKFYEKVCLKKGKMYDVTKNLKFDYDNETVDFEPIEFSTNETDKIIDNKSN